MIQIRKRPFGVTAAGRPVDCWTLTNDHGVSAEILAYGGILRALRVPTPTGLRDVVLGFDTLADYEKQDKYIGALVGRVANRIGGASFQLNGKTYTLAVNNGPNCNHGGIHGFHEKVWSACANSEGELILTCTSPDGEEGFPGTLHIQVTYTLGEDDSLTLSYQASSDADTLVNLTNHSYFNLNGHSAGNLDGHTIQIFADAITENDETSVPTGRMLDVTGTPFDLRQPVPFGPGLASDHPQIRMGNGYDHNFVLHDAPTGPLRLAAAAQCADLRLECYATQPGLQLYTANYLENEVGKDGAVYPPRAAFCLETQCWPDAIHQPSFPSVVLPMGQTYRQTTVFRFSPVTAE